MTSWPSGLRRNVKAVVLVGVGSNPTDVTFALPHPIKMPDEICTNPLYSVPTPIHVSQNTKHVDIPNQIIYITLAISAPHPRKYYPFYHLCHINCTYIKNHVVLRHIQMCVPVKFKL